MTEEYLEELKTDFAKIVTAFGSALQTIRTGRASPQLIEGVSITVASYGSNMPLRQLATITAPDARMLLVNPWDKGTMTDVERGIHGGQGLPGEARTVFPLLTLEHGILVPLVVAQGRGDP